MSQLLDNLICWDVPTRYDNVRLTGMKTECRGNKPVFVFLHGNGFSPLIYLPLLERLYPTFDLYIPEVQGHGNNPAGNRFLGWDVWADIIGQHLKEVRSDWPIVIGAGHSFGGVVTTNIAAAEPGIYDKLILLDPIYLPRRLIYTSLLLKNLGLSVLHPMVRLTRNRKSHFSGSTELIEQIRGRGVFKNWTEAALNAYGKYSLRKTAENYELRTPVWLECAIFSSYSNRLYRSAKTIACPVLLVYGKDTYPYQISEIIRLSRKNPNIKLLSLSGGHCFMQAFPEMVATRILKHQEH